MKKQINVQAKIVPLFRVLTSLLGYKQEIAKISLKNLHSFWSYLEKTRGVKMIPSPFLLPPPP